MTKKIKCKNCETEFIPTLGAAQPACPQCQTPAPMATARAAFATGEPVLLPAAGASDEFDLQWMPPGRQTPCCFVEGQPRDLEFTVKPEHATAFNAQLQRLRSTAAAGQGDAPYIDFNHEDGRASGRPTEFYWGGEDPKKGGIRLKGKWTASGRQAVTGEAPEFTRFSPEWYFDEDSEPLAIGINLGGLVNRAAFQQIASVKAGAANHNQKTDMTKEEFSALLTDALKPINSEIAALKATAKGTETVPVKTGETTELEKAIAKAMTPITQKLTDMENAAATGRKAQAKSAVQIHVTRGAIAPADTASVEFWENAWLANAGSAETQMQKLPGKVAGRVIVQPGAGRTHTATAAAAELSEPERLMLEGARKLREGNKAIASDAQALEVYLRTPEGNALYAETLAGRSNQRRDVSVAR